jgi:hypothetical protein
MNKSEALKQLKEALKEEPELLKLSHENPRRNMWVYRVDDILREGFGPNSDELKLFVEGVPRDELKGSDRQLQKRLDSRLMRRATIIRSIIEKHERQKEMVNPEDMEFYKGLQDWLEELELFQKELYGGNMPHDELEPMRDKLIRSAPKFKRRVIELTGKQYGEQFGRTFDVWDAALSPYVYDGLNWPNRFSLNALVDCVNEALGVLEAGASVTSVPSRYQLTSPVYWIERFRRWVERFRRWKPLSTAVTWVKTHRLLSALITAIMVLAAILTILGWVLEWIG